MSDLFEALSSDDGYPSDEGLRALRAFEGTPHELFHALEGTFGRMGVVSVKKPEDVLRSGLPYMEVYLATGGWSGNESMISALQSSFFWFCWWEMSIRGGGFNFHVPENRWDEPMPEWPPAVEANRKEVDG